MQKPTEFASDAGKFSIKFKVSPKESTSDVPTEIGDVKNAHVHARRKCYKSLYGSLL